MADIAARSLAISDGWGAGYVPTGTPASPRYTVTKNIVNNGNGTATITLSVTVKTNSGWVGGGYIFTLHFTCAGVTATPKVWKASATNWNQNSTYTTSISVTIPLDGTTTKSANLSLTNNQGTHFTFSSSAQGGNEITSIPVGYLVATFTAFSNFTSNASSIAVTVRERTASLKNRMTLKIGSTTIKTWTNLDNVDSLALVAAEHAAIHNAVPNSGSATATMVMETLNGTSVIGTVTRTATVTIASTIVPTLTSITAAETVSAVSTLLGAGSYAQSLSRIKFTINGAKEGQGATISSYKIVFNGVTWTTSTATTGAINKSGAITATGTVTDSRGRSASKTVSVTLLAYSAPALTSVQTRRASTTGGPLSDEGVYLRVDRNASISALGNKNRLTLKIEHKLSTNTTWIQTYSNTWAAGTNSISGQTVPTGYTFSAESTFDIRITVSDKFRSTVATGKLSSAKFPLIVGIDGIGVNKVPADGRALDVSGKSYFDGKVYLEGGVEYISIPADSDLNDYTTPGFYKCSMNVTVATFKNSPTGSAFSMVVESNAGVTQIIKTYLPSSFNVYIRHYYSSTGWGGWFEYFTSNGIQVLTSTSGGTARCVRYPNGWQEIGWKRSLTTTITLPSGAIYYSNSTLATTAWPWAFTEAPSVSILAHGNGQLIWYGTPWSPSATECPGVYIYKGSSDSTSRTYGIDIKASGRWK